MDKPSIEEVIAAIDSLYRGENPADKERASSWLTRLHSSVSEVDLVGVGMLTFNWVSR